MDYTFQRARMLVFQYRWLPLVWLALIPASISAQTLLVVNQGDSNLSIVDPVAGREVATIAEKTPGVHGHEVAVSADGRTAFVPSMAVPVLESRVLMGTRCWSSTCRRGRSLATSILVMGCDRIFLFSTRRAGCSM